MTNVLQWTSCTGHEDVVPELMFAMCGNTSYEPDDDIILESTKIIPQTDEDYLVLFLMNVMVLRRTGK
ncbi:hypothetical protein AVEN_12033-1, partial [Araneus ventricosus]